MSNNTFNISIPAQIWLRVGLVFVIFIVLYTNVIIQIVNTWFNREDYSHGLLIPFISLYFIWSKKEELQRTIVAPQIWSGLIITLSAGILLLLGNIGSVVMAQEISLLLILPGLVLMLLGTQFLRTLALPISYLIFMAPILDEILSRIRWPFQLIAAKLSGILLNVLGIPVFQHRQYLELPNISLEVAEACSGVNFFIAILAIAVPLAYFTQERRSRRIMLIAFAIIIGILTNTLRVTLIGIYTFNGGTDVHGPLHVFQGLFVSVVGFIFLFITAWVFAKFSPSRTMSAPTEKKETPLNPGYDLKKINHASFVAMGALLTLAGVLFLHEPKPVPLKMDLVKFPFLLKQWEGVDDVSRAVSLNITGADSVISRIYRHTDGGELSVSIGYFQSQKQGRELIDYRFEKLYKKAEQIPLMTDQQALIHINKTVFTDGAKKYLAIYWYDLNGRIVADRYKAKLITIMDGLIHNRTNGALVVVSRNVNEIDSVTALNTELEFAKALIPTLSDYLP